MQLFNTNIDWLLQHSQQNPNGISIVTGNRSYSFLVLNKLVDNKSKILIAKGIKIQNHCAVISNNNLDFVITVLALWRIGAVPIPLNIRLTNNELAEQIKFTDCKHVVLHDDFKNKFGFENINLIEIPFENSKSDLSFENNFGKSETSLMLFTSGSTDKPKAVQFTFENLINSAAQTINLIDAEGNDSWLASLPFYHIGGFMIFVRALINDNPLVIPETLNHRNISEAINNHSPSIISFVSTQMKEMISNNIQPPKNLKAVFLGGGPIENELIFSAKEKGWKIIKVYGSTETCSMATALDLRKEIIKIDSAGKAIETNSISIADNKAQGEIIIKSNSVAKNYYKDSGAKLSNNRFHSNDFGFIDDEGYLFIKGRVDDIIISGGENINTKEVTEVILSNSKVSDAFTFGLKDEKWGQAVASAVVKKDEAITEEMLKEYLMRKLASFKIPKQIFFVKQIPKTELGKVRKDELLKSLNLY